MKTELEDKRKHLDYIQATISRMGSNQFITRGWSITILTGLIALIINNKKYDLLWLSISITVIFWGIDGYYLALERRFRELYEITIKKDYESIDYSMKIKPITFCCWISTLFKRPILSGFYGLILLMEVFALLILKNHIIIK